MHPPIPSPKRAEGQCAWLLVFRPVYGFVAVTFNFTIDIGHDQVAIPEMTKLPSWDLKYTTALLEAPKLSLDTRLRGQRNSFSPASFPPHRRPLVHRRIRRGPWFAYPMHSCLCLPLILVLLQFVTLTLAPGTRFILFVTTSSCFR